MKTRLHIMRKRLEEPRGLWIGVRWQFVRGTFGRRSGWHVSERARGSVHFLNGWRAAVTVCLVPGLPFSFVVLGEHVESEPQPRPERKPA